MFTFPAAFATDQVTASPVPDRWAIGPLMTTALALAIPLLILCFGVFWAGTHVFGLDTAKTQTLIFAWFVFAGSQGILYATRSRGFLWTRPYPSRWLNAVTLVLVVATIVLAIEGWLMAAISPSLVAGMLLLAVLYLIAADAVKVALARSTLTRHY